ncbi:MAG: DUF2283 domain-containing protein [Terriglobia bacterium]|jgi:uncharacterized protein YuzE
MTIQCIEGTDTLYITLRKGDVVEARGLDENTLVEFDATGDLVSMTIEHARERTDVGNFTYQQVPAMKPVL